jgi:serine protease Do
LSDGSFEDFLQTDAPINQGNSGGALVNTRGELIGITSHIVSPSGGNIGIGFAIPSNMAKTVLGQLVKGGTVRRGQLGVSIQPVSSDIATSLGLKDVRGVLVSSVTPGSAADKAGIKSGDVILAMNGQPTNSSNDLRNRVAATTPGSEVTLTLFRNGSEQQVKANVGELTPESARNQQGGTPQSESGGKFGLSARPLTSDDASQLGLPPNTHGALVQSVEPGSPAADAGLQEADVIQQANGQAVQNADELRRALQKSGSKPALVLVNRGGQTIYVTLKPAS